MDVIWDLLVSPEVGTYFWETHSGDGSQQIHHELKMDSAVSREQTEVGIWGGNDSH